VKCFGTCRHGLGRPLTNRQFIIGYLLFA